MERKSIKERMAIAKKKADEQNLNRPKKKNNDDDPILELGRKRKEKKELMI